MKDYGKIKNHYILSGCKEFIWMEMSQKLPAVDFKQVEITSRFNKDLIGNHNENSDERYILEVDVQYHKKL